MSWAPKRFWKAATVQAVDGGWTVLLDTRPVKTPAKAPLVLPTEGLARLVASEWDAQTGKIDPNSMPATRMANSALDKVAPMVAAVADHLAEYGGSDLLCYRAAKPAELVRRQAEGWDPLLDWAAEALQARLTVTVGVMHVPQPEPALTALRSHLGGFSSFQLAAFHDLVAISGSLILALAVAHKRLSPEEAWDLARIDETFQAEEWGEDEEAAEVAALKRADFLSASRVFALLG
ncbi:ATP12 family chaperone protein [Stagnihabitans tardus]|uniref:ATPase n=1 Tax=Stagnihabitans tardus TaxID=2699202 RepID=A0AAE5BWF5_9RHOB|nr:ATP12 family protein [Stagnihabitans tardus]NBZ89257.1 ATPase [Stagnihabitans tardus]